MMRPLLGFLLLVFAGGPAAAALKVPAFRARRDYVTPYTANALLLAKTTSDGFLDIIQTGAEVMFGNGNGTFRPGPASNLGFFGGFPVAVDLDGDGAVDLVMAGVQKSGGPIGVAVSFGNGNGTFQTAVFYQAGTDTQNGGVVVGDFNGDGIPDAATIGESGIWLFTGKGGGTFNAPVLTPFAATRIDSLDLASGDFNGDGKLDLLVELSTGFAVFLGNGNGTFQPPINVVTPKEPALY